MNRVGPTFAIGRSRQAQWASVNRRVKSILVSLETRIPFKTAGRTSEDNTSFAAENIQVAKSVASPTLEDCKFSDNVGKGKCSCDQQQNLENKSVVKNQKYDQGRRNTAKNTKVTVDSEFEFRYRFCYEIAQIRSQITDQVDRAANTV